MNKKKLPSLEDLDQILNLDQLEVWDIQDPRDQAFWNEFFKIEELIATTDDLEPATFTITVQNHQTGEVKTYRNVSLKSARRKIYC